MRVLMVTDFYDPYVGGVEQHVRSLAHALVRRGHHVSVATLWTPRTGPRLDHDGPVTVHRVTSLASRLPSLFASADRPWAPPVLDPFVLAGLRRVVAVEQPDLVHGHDWLARSVWPLCLGRRPLVTSLHYYTRSCAKKTLWTDGGPCPGPAIGRCLSCASAHFGPLKGTVTVGAARLGAAIEDRVSRRVIAVSDATARGNGLDPSARCRTVPNLLAQPAEPVRHDRRPVAAVSLDPPPDVPPELVGATTTAAPARGPATNGHRPTRTPGVRSAAGWAPPGAVEAGTAAAPGRARPGPSAVVDRPVLPASVPAEPFLLYVGDLRPVKGVDVLLDAYRQLRDAPPLVLLGEHHGRSVTDLPAGVVAPGPVSNDAVREAWRRCLFGVVPSIWAEPFGIVVIEAMAAGRTVVASEVGGIPEIVDAERSGLLVAPNDPGALARGVQRLLDDRELRVRLEHEARRSARRYRPDLVASEVEQVYQDALATRSAAA